MNFLAHFYLSGTSEEILVGNFLGDFVKGRNFATDFPEEIAQGIALHRAIDSYTDQHPTVRLGTARLQPVFRKYAGVLIDVFYDYCLASEWAKFSEEDLLFFTEKSYKILKKHKELFPPKAKHVLHYMSRDNWLYHYQNLKGIARVLGGMERRSRFDSKLSAGVKHLERDEKLYKKEFESFFPEVMRYTQEFLKKNS